jgi:serine/threonine protein kinase
VSSSEGTQDPMIHSSSVDTAQFPSGEMLDEKYRIDRLISIGGMGAVYLGTHVLLKKQVAIKVLRTEFVGAVEMVERFQREAVAASAIGHQNIVSITDMGKTKGGVAFLVMEYLEGRSLQDAIDEEGQFSIADACDIACEILAGVAAAHRAGIVHRDLKPANVFMVRRSDGSEAVKLLDFGIAILAGSDKPDHRLTMTGMVLGTPHYMAPEQARGDKEITEAVDIYAVGVILYEMLCHAVPYEGENYNVLIYQVLSGDYVKPSTRRPDLPPDLEAVVIKALALKPWDRFASADELMDALEPFRSNQRSMPSVRIPVQKLGRQNKRSETATSETLAASPSSPMPPLDRTEATEATGPMRMDSQLGDTLSVTAISDAQAARRSPVRIVLAALALTVAAGVALALLWPQDGAPPPKAAAAPVTAPPVPIDTAPEPPGDTPEEVVLEFSVTPPEATVTVDGQPVENGELARPAGDTPLTVKVEAEGYEPRELQIKPDRSRIIDVELDEKTVAPAPGARTTPGRRNPRDRRNRPKNDRIITDDPYSN